MFRNRDQRPPVERAIDAVAGLKPGTWESVRALAWLARADRELAGA